jgi:hypothetical protein
MPNLSPATEENTSKQAATQQTAISYYGEASSKDGISKLLKAKRKWGWDLFSYPEFSFPAASRPMLR